MPQERKGSALSNHPTEDKNAGEFSAGSGNGFSFQTLEARNRLLLRLLLRVLALPGGAAGPASHY